MRMMPEARAFWRGQALLVVSTWGNTAPDLGCVGFFFHSDRRMTRASGVQPISLEVLFSKAQSSKLERLFCHVSVKRDFELWAFSLETSFENATPSGISCTINFFYRHTSGTAMVIPLNPPAPMNYVKYLRAGPAEMPFQNWFTANTNHFEMTDSVRWKSKRQLGWVINPVPHNLVRRIRFWRIKISGTWF